MRGGAGADGGGGACARAEAAFAIGGRGASVGGGGGGAGGGGAEEGGGGGADGADGAEVVGIWSIDGFLLPGGAGGFFPIGGGGPFSEAEELGRGTAFRFFRRAATEGREGAVAAGCCGAGLGGKPVGGFGAAIAGGLGAELLEDSGSDVYEDSRLAVSHQKIGLYNMYHIVLPPVSMPPPRFFNFGIPPAKSPPNCGGCSVTLLLLSLPL